MNIDPAAIDLEPIRATWQNRGVAPAYNIMALIAAVEALRERVAELERGYDIWCKTANQQAEMRKAAEAHVMDLEELLKEAVK